jgi:phage gp45-like
MSFLRKIIHSLQIGRATTATTDGGPIRTLQLTFMTLGNVISSISQMQHYGFASRPHAMSDHAVIALGNDPSMSISIASNDQRYQISLVEGEVAIHDDLGQTFHITRTGWKVLDQYGNTSVSSSTGIVQTDTNGSVLSMAGSTITLAPKNAVVNVTGEIAMTGNAGVGGTVTGSWAIQGSLSATGSISATGDITAGSGGAGAISLLHHVHAGVTTGGGSTAAPTAGT